MVVDMYGQRKLLVAARKQTKGMKGDEVYPSKACS